MVEMRTVYRSEPEIGDDYVGEVLRSLQHKLALV
jgi:hypothetical protein